MSWKKILAYSFSLLYLILVSLFLNYSKMEIMCGFEKPCVRFCSLDAEKYSDKILFDEFMESKMSNWYKDTELDDANIFRGLPLCNGKVKPLEIVEDDNDESDEYDHELRIFGVRLIEIIHLKLGA